MLLVKVNFRKFHTVKSTLHGKIFLTVQYNNSNFKTNYSLNIGTDDNCSYIFLFSFSHGYSFQKCLNFFGNCLNTAFWNWQLSNICIYRKLTKRKKIQHLLNKDTLLNSKYILDFLIQLKSFFLSTFFVLVFLYDGRHQLYFWKYVPSALLACHSNLERLLDVSNYQVFTWKTTKR